MNVHFGLACKPSCNNQVKPKRSTMSRLIFLGVVLTVAGFASELRGQPGGGSQWTDTLELAVHSAIAEKKMPGAVVCIGNHKETVYLKAFGHLSLLPKREKMKTDTVFDLASLTKPIATATSILILLEAGKVRMRDSAATYLPDFAVNGKRSITVQQLLTHCAGLIPDNALADYQDGPELALRKINELKPTWVPGSRFAYTDVGFIVLGEIVRKQSGETLDRFSSRQIFQKLGMHETGFRPGEDLARRSAVTQQRNGKWIKGKVHDPRAFALGGVAGHAGLFSTATDLAKYCRMLLNRGQGRQGPVLSPRTVEVMTSAYELNGGIKRGLGWDKQSPYSSNRGELMSDKAFGHGGFTGTSLWIDPELDLFVIFLSNRVHPDGKGSVNRLAGRIGTLASAAFSQSKLAK
jgi:CubicO group peptidase (beta-lactamase class C family)